MRLMARPRMDASYMNAVSSQDVYQGPDASVPRRTRTHCRDECSYDKLVVWSRNESCELDCDDNILRNDKASEQN